MGSKMRFCLHLLVCIFIAAFVFIPWFNTHTQQVEGNRMASEITQKSLKPHSDTFTNSVLYLVSHRCTGRSNCVIFVYLSAIYMVDTFSFFGAEHMLHF